MRSTTVFLDAGGVILDESEFDRIRTETAVDVLRAVIPEYGLHHLYADLEEAIRLFCPRILSFVLWKNLQPDLDLYGKCYEEFRRLWAGRRPPIRLMEGFGAEVKKIAGDFEVGIAGQYGAELLDLLESHSLLRHFTYRYTQDDFDITKPDPRYLERIAARCGVEPSRCVMVGDRVDNDVIPARQLGMKAVLVRVGLHRNQHPRVPPEFPDAEVDGIAGLGDAVRRVGVESEG
jgi:FMN phosphatase YigB (HAD superfamily)